MNSNNYVGEFLTHFNYTVEKEGFLNSLSDEDLNFIQKIAEKALDSLTQEDQLKAKKIDQNLKRFERVEQPALITLIMGYVTSWLSSPQSNTLERKKTIQDIRSKFSESHLPEEALYLHLAYHPEIGQYEELFKEPAADQLIHNSWQSRQDNYWKRIADMIGYPMSITPGKVAESVKAYLQSYKSSILAENGHTYTRDQGNCESPVTTIPGNILELLKVRPTIANFLEVKQWKADIDKKKILWVLEWDSPYHFIFSSSYRATVFSKDISDKEIAKNFDAQIEQSISFAAGYNYLRGSSVPLDLSGLNLSSLPESLSTLPFMTSLDLSNNRLSIVPEWLEKLDTLQTLDLSNNLIDTYPETIGHLKHLGDGKYQSHVAT